jgi:ABC-type uncharacterized transport system permease subunit
VLVRTTALLVLVAVVALTANLMRSKFGLAFVAIREDPLLAASVGVRTPTEAASSGSSRIATNASPNFERMRFAVSATTATRTSSAR